MMKRLINVLSYSLTAVMLLYMIQSCEKKNVIPKDQKTNKDSTQIAEYNDSTVKNAYSNLLEAKQSDNISLLGKTNFELGYYYLTKSKSDSAFYYFNHAKEAFLQLKDSTFVGKSLLNMSIVQIHEGDYYGSEETSVEALKFLKNPKNSPYISSVYNNLAVSKIEQKDYPQAVEYYNLAIRSPKDTLLNIIIKNNQAVVNIKAKKSMAAIDSLSSLIKNPVLKKYPKEKARVIDNLAFARWQHNSSYTAEQELYLALQIREQAKDSTGQIANHYHLSQYFTKINPEKAVFHANKMYEIAKKLGTPDDLLEALQKLIVLEDPEHAKKYFSIYLKTNDSMQSARSRAKNQFTLIRYEVEKNKEENLSLKAENAQKNLQIFKQRMIVFSIAGFTIISFILFYLWYRRRRQKFKEEKREEVRRTELMYSKKIHDDVANGVYALMVSLDNNIRMEKREISDELEHLYHRSRNISHESELREEIRTDYYKLLLNSIESYGGKSVRIIMVGNEPSIWKKIPMIKKEEIYYVLVELMTNMKKHSKASLVTLRFKKENGAITIDYSDNGVGLNEKIGKPSRGMKNIESRITSIQGRFISNPEENKTGYSAKIIVPI